LKSDPALADGIRVQDIEGGFPHSEILGSKPVRSSPKLIAAYHVLHRLLAPRHPPNALLSLNHSHYRCPPPLGAGTASVRPGHLRPDRKDQLASEFTHMTAHSCPAGSSPNTPFGMQTQMNSLFTMSDNTQGSGRSPRNTLHPGRTDRDRRQWWSQTDSNRRHPACKAGALPTELWPQTGERD
jgi:hypothetical protein